MQDPKISWFVKDPDGIFVPQNEYHAGTYTKADKIVVDFQIWNNRWGVEDVKELTNPVLNFYFDTIEDATLLNLCKITVDEYDNIPLMIKEQKASAVLGRSLSGVKNNGDETAAANRNNFVNIRFEFDAADYRLKENDLKNLYFELVSMD